MTTLRARPLVILTDAQRSDEWRQARLGRVTGSRAADVLATIKSGEAAKRRDYRIELVCERLTGLPAEEGFVSADMRRGTELEPIAFVRYEALTGQIVRRTGFVSHTGVMVGCSLDGDVGDLAGIVELKCPKMATHWRYLRAGTMPAEHRAQVIHSLWVTGAAWADFVSFDDRFPVALQVFRMRLDRDAVTAEIDTYAAAAEQFLREVDDECAAASALERHAAAS